jgi:hypothetical protein
MTLRDVSAPIFGQEDQSRMMPGMSNDERSGRFEVGCERELNTPVMVVLDVKILAQCT